METEVIKVDRQTGHAEAIHRATEVLAGGGLVAFPTETVYGVGARVDRPEAMERIRGAKARPPERAFTVHLGSPGDAFDLAPDLNSLAGRLIRKAWPGPLTLVVNVKEPDAAPVMSRLDGAAGAAMYYQGSIGLRCPDDSIAASMLRAVDAPIVAASANKSGQAPPWTGEDVLRGLEGRIDLLIDAGRTKYTKPSTIVRVKDGDYELVREGVYDAGSIARLVALRILFVCTGNTCRSPMAEGLARDVLARRFGIDPTELADRRIVISSAGTAGGYGSASQHAVQVMAGRGIDISAHRSSYLSPDVIRQADYVFVMTRGHRDRVIEMVPASRDRVVLLLDDDVDDPIGGDKNEYERCAQMIEQGVRARLEEVTL